MKRLIADASGNIVGEEEATPKCGDFCESCGNCIVCYGEDSCPQTPDGQHVWVRYSENPHYTFSFLAEDDGSRTLTITPKLNRSSLKGLPRNELIDLSCAKWRAIVKDVEEHGPATRHGIETTTTCALCALYFDYDCHGCPVSQRTGTPYCEESPFDEISLFASDAPLDIAKRELAFLESLKS